MMKMNRELNKLRKYTCLYPNAEVTNDLDIVLKPLNKLTAAHKQKLAEILEWEGFEVIYHEEARTLEFDWQELCYPENHKIQIDWLPVKAADFLRSKSYDIDGLIDKKIAITK